jgi:putative hydrolase of the HAD superfamily
MNRPEKLNVAGIIFDLGSTLLEYETIPWSELDLLCAESGLEFLRRNGKSAPPTDIFYEKLLEVWQMYRTKAEQSLIEWRLTDALAEVLNSFGLNGDQNFINRFFDAFYKPVSNQLSLYADAPTVLSEIKSRGKIIGLISNTIFPEEYHLRELKKFGLIEYFDFTIFSITFGYRKPHRSIFQKAAELSLLDPNQLLYVGDRYLEDVKGPRECGWSSILKYRDGRDYPDPLPDDTLVIKTLTDLLDYI